MSMPSVERKLAAILAADGFAVDHASTVAAAEAAIGLAILITVYRNRSHINVDEIDLMKW